MKFNKIKFKSFQRDLILVKKVHCLSEIINQPLKYNYLLHNEKAKMPFHSLESQHFKAINVGFFLLNKTVHQ